MLFICLNYWGTIMNRLLTVFLGATLFSSLTYGQEVPVGSKSLYYLGGDSYRQYAGNQGLHVATCATKNISSGLLSLTQYEYAGESFRKADTSTRGTDVELSCGRWSSQIVTLTSSDYKPASLFAIYRSVQLIKGDTFSIGLTFGAAKIGNSIPREARIAALYWRGISWAAYISLIPTNNSGNGSVYYMWLSVPFE